MVKEDIKFWAELIFSGISAISAAISLIAIFLLIKERQEKNRPYLQISFELIRSTLACVVFRNTGYSPLTVKSIIFSQEFLTQLAGNKQFTIDGLKNANIDIFPGRYWVLSLDVNVFDIISKFNPKSLKIDYEYTKIKGKKRYIENDIINFEQYKAFLIYLSELDEFRQSNEKYQEAIIKAIDENTTIVTTLQDSFVKRIPKSKTNKTLLK